MKIHAIQTGVVHVKTDFMRGSAAAGSTPAFFYRLFTDKQTVDLPIYTWVIEHEEGVIVVDTGELADTNKNFITQSTFTIQPEEQICPQLEKLGIKPRDVSKVILTHLHGDHVNGANFFKDNDIYLGDDEYAEYQSPVGGALIRATTRLGSWFVPKPLERQRTTFGPFDYFYPITKAGDVIAVPTPGHTAGHISVIAMSEGISYFLAGDVTYDEQALLDHKLQGPSMALSSHPETINRILQYVQSMPTVYLPAHDWKSGERFAARKTVMSDLLLETVR